MMGNVLTLKYGNEYRRETTTQETTVIYTSEKKVFKGQSTSSSPFLVNVSTLTELFHFTPLRTFLERVVFLSEEDLEHLLLRYSDKNILSLLMKINPVDIRKLVALLLWIESRYDVYGKILLDLTFDPETNEFQFLNIVISECDWDTWKRIVKEIKNEMKKNNLTEMTSKVAIVCLRGLLELTH